jgi:hypothetical protein
MNTPVNFEIAKLLKEKGFDERPKSYNEDGKLVAVSLTIRRFNPEKIYYPAPTISEVIDWMYEKHGIWISVFEMERSEDWSNYFDYSIKQKKINGVDISKKLEEFNNPTEAYEAAILYTLKNLI